MARNNIVDQKPKANQKPTHTQNKNRNKQTNKIRMALGSIHTTDHRHFFSGNLTLKDSTAIYKQNRLFLSTKKPTYFSLSV